MGGTERADDVCGVCVWWVVSGAPRQNPSRSATCPNLRWQIISCIDNWTDLLKLKRQKLVY